MLTKKNYFKYLLTLSIIFTFFLIGNSVLATGAAQKVFNKSLNYTGMSAGYKNDLSVYDKTPASIIGSIIKAVLAFMGVIFLILMIYGGFKWMMAKGNEQDVTAAKDIIRNAIIGLIVVLSAYAITTFIGIQIAATTVAPE